MKDKNGGTSGRREISRAEIAALGVGLNFLAQWLGPPAAAKEVYAKSTRPSFAPPSWAFGLVWPINNFLTLWANRRVYNSPASPERARYLKLQALSWVLFVTYGLARFRLKSPKLGLLNTATYLAVTLGSMVYATRIDRRLLLSFVTLVPWLALATTLSLYQRNDPDPLFDHRR